MARRAAGRARTWGLGPGQPGKRPDGPGQGGQPGGGEMEPGGVMTPVAARHQAGGPGCGAEPSGGAGRCTDGTGNQSPMTLAMLTFAAGRPDMSWL
jgi:hypothetical protein